MKRQILVWILAIAWIGVRGLSAQVVYVVVPEESIIRIHLGKSGLFGFLGDEHDITAPVSTGRIVYDEDRLESSSVEIEIIASEIKVQDPHLKPSDREKVQKTMESDRVLWIERYPRIFFQSSKVERVRTRSLFVTGDLQLRDQKKRVKIELNLQTQGKMLRVQGGTKIKQTEFGIKPVAAGGGTVKVKDELELTFEIRATAVETL